MKIGLITAMNQGETVKLPCTSVLAAVGLIVLGLALGARGLVRPIGQDDTYNLMAARILAEGRPVADDGAGGTALLYQPPVYPWLLSIAHRMLGSGVGAARTIGWLGYAVAGGLLFILVRRLADGSAACDRAALLALALYLFNPTVLQASAMIDIDPTVLPVWVLLWLLLLFRCVEAPQATWFTALAGAAAMGLGLKLSTPSVVMGVSLATLAVVGIPWPIVLKTAAAVVTGGIAFAISYTYWGAQRRLALSHLIRYIVGQIALRTAEGFSIVGTLLKAGIELSLWISPFFLLLAVAGTVWGLTQMDWRLRLMALLGGFLFVGYLVIGGTTFGYPKYHVPALPILCALVGVWIAPTLHGIDRWTQRVAMVLAGILVAWNLCVVRDLIFALRYIYRGAAALAAPQAHEILADIAWRGVALLVPTVLVIAILARKIAGWGPRLCMSLLVATFGSTLALDISQGTTSFSSSHYGEAGTEAVASFLRMRLDPGARVIATREILFLLEKLDEPTSSPLAVATWNDPTQFHAQLADPHLGAVVYSVSANTISQYQRIFRNPAVRYELEVRFQHERIGSYSVWWRAGS